jgi:hypothetical protein
MNPPPSVQNGGIKQHLEYLIQMDKTATDSPQEGLTHDKLLLMRDLNLSGMTGEPIGFLLPVSGFASRTRTQMARTATLAIAYPNSARC